MHIKSMTFPSDKLHIEMHSVQISWYFDRKALMFSIGYPLALFYSKTISYECESFYFPDPNPNQNISK